MHKIHDPLGLVEKDPQLKARVIFIEKIVKPVCAVLIVGPILFMSIVFVFELIKHG